MKRYSIDGIYGRVEFDSLNEQKGFFNTHNIENINQNTGENEGEQKEFISGLPINDEQYFNLALIQALDNINRELNNIDETLTQLFSTQNKDDDAVAESEKDDLIKRAGTPLELSQKDSSCVHKVESLDDKNNTTY